MRLKQLRALRRRTTDPRFRKIWSLQIRNLHRREVRAWKTGQLQMFLGSASRWKNLRKFLPWPSGKHIEIQPHDNVFAWVLYWIFDAELVRVEIRLGFVVSLRPKGAAFGQAGSTRLCMCAWGFVCWSDSTCGKAERFDWTVVEFGGAASRGWKCTSVEMMWVSQRRCWSMPQQNSGIICCRCTMTPFITALCFNRGVALYLTCCPKRCDQHKLLIFGQELTSACFARYLHVCSGENRTSAWWPPAGGATRLSSLETHWGAPVDRKCFLGENLGCWYSSVGCKLRFVKGIWPRPLASTLEKSAWTRHLRTHGLDDFEIIWRAIWRGHWIVRSKQIIQHHRRRATRMCYEPSPLLRRVTVCFAEMEIESWWPCLWFVGWDAASHRFTICRWHLTFCTVGFGSGKIVG